MWLPILANFFNIIFVIFGIFGLYQYRSHYLAAYTVWSLVWIGFNVFIICYYLSIGDLNADEDLLSFGTGSFSWSGSGSTCSSSATTSPSETSTLTRTSSASAPGASAGLDRVQRVHHLLLPLHRRPQR